LVTRIFYILGEIIGGYPENVESLGEIIGGVPKSLQNHSKELHREFWDFRRNYRGGTPEKWS